MKDASPLLLFWVYSMTVIIFFLQWLLSKSTCVAQELVVLVYEYAMTEQNLALDKTQYT